MSARKGRGGQKIRMEHIAARAGVSQMTVSRALRRPELVAERTRERIKAAVSEVGYIPNRVAGGLRSRRTETVGLIIPTLANTLLSHMVHGISDVLGPRGFNLMLGISGVSLDQEEQLVRAFLAYRPAGMLIHNTTHTAVTRTLLQDAGIPVIELGDLVGKPIDRAVSFSNFAAAKAMTLYLAERYRKIAFLGLKLHGRGQQRRRGYVAALRQVGMPVERDLMLEVAHEPGSVGPVLARLLQDRPDVDAVFCAGDTMAVDALAECRAQGWAVPQRIAIAGFDDHHLAEKLPPALTTLRIPRYEIGQRAAELLLTRLDGESIGERVVDLGFELMARASA